MPAHEHKRAHRVGQLIQEELGQLLVEGVKDPRVGFVTVTEVRLDDDLRDACVYVSVVGSVAQREASLTGLAAAAGFLRRELGRRLRLRFTPTLTFAYDDTLARAHRLDVLLTAAAEGALEAPPLTAEAGLPTVQTRRIVPPPQPPRAEVRRPAKSGRRRARTKRLS